MTKKCDLCQRPIDWYNSGGGMDMYAHKPCCECKWGTNSCIPNLPDHFTPKLPTPKLLEITLLYCRKCNVFWWNYHETICPDFDCKGPLKKLLMREVID